MLEEAPEIWRAVQGGGMTLLDVRPAQAYAKSHVPGAISAPFSRQGWGRAVATFLDGKTVRIGVFSDSEVLLRAAEESLAAEGLSLDAALAGGVAAWERHGLPLVSVKPLTVDELKDQLNAWTVIDVREPYEWRSGVVPGAQRIPLGSLPEALPGLTLDKAYAVVCAHGSRSQQGAAFLAEQGFNAANVVGGMALWLGAGHPVEMGS